jgi:NADH-quinone oxidoreductase subunit E
MIAPAQNLPEEFITQIDEVVSHYPVSKRSAALPLLHLWQERFGYIGADGIEWIANRLELQPINILELVTFYPMFRQEPFGKFHVKVCRTLSCALGGSYKTLEHFKNLTGATGDEHGPMHSPDGRFTVEFVECQATCGTPPVVVINEDFHEKVDEAKVAELVRQCREKELCR